MCVISWLSAMLVPSDYYLHYYLVTTNYGAKLACLYYLYA